MKSESLPTRSYPNEKDASFALFHFTGNVGSIEKFVVNGINQYSADEIEKIKQTEMDLATKISKNAWLTFRGSKERIEVPDKALCCSLAISSSVPEDKLKIKFFDTSSLMRGVGIVMEDPKKVLVPHADYFAFNSGGNLPPNLVKKNFLDPSSKVELRKTDLRRGDASLSKPARVAFYSARLPSFPVTNYASYSHESKEVLENKGGEKGFFNFARNFYRTSLRGQSRHDKPKWNRKSKYYPLDKGNNKRPEANYTELLVYQKKGEDNPITGVVLNIDVLRFGKDDLEKLKALFEKNQNLALYIYDSSLERDFIRKVESLDEIKSHLDLIKANLSGVGSCFELTESNRSSIAKANSELPVFRNQILKESSALGVDLSSSPVPQVDLSASPALAPPPPKVATLQEDVKRSFRDFYAGLDTKDEALKLLSFLWGGGSDVFEYDKLKNQLAEKHKEKYTGSKEEILGKALGAINEFNRQSAIEKLQELNQKEAEGADKKTTDFVQNYHQIHSELGLNKFLEKDEFDLGKKEMLTFVGTKDKSERLKKIDELRGVFEGEVKDIDILSFFSEIQNQENNQSGSNFKKNLREIWDRHEEIMKRQISNPQHAPKDDYADNLKAVARRDFLLLAIDSMENQEHKVRLEEYVKTNYKEGCFLKSFGGLVKTLSAPASAPHHESKEEKRNRQCNEFLNWIDYFKKEDIKPYIEGGAIIGGFGGGLIGGGLCVSALGVGAILSTPIIMPVVVGVSVGVGVGVVGGLVVGAIVKNANATQLSGECAMRDPLNKN